MTSSVFEWRRPKCTTAVKASSRTPTGSAASKPWAIQNTAVVAAVMRSMPATWTLQLLIRSFMVEDLLDGRLEVVGDGDRERQRREIAPGLDRVDRLPGDAQVLAEITLRQAARRPPLANVVLHACKASLTGSECQGSLTSSAASPDFFAPTISSDRPVAVAVRQGPHIP